MIRVIAAAFAAVLLAAAAAPRPVEYRIGLHPDRVDVELRLRGDADGQTRLVLPPGATLSVRGATTAGNVLSHRPDARLTVLYALTLRPDSGPLLGEDVFARPEGRPFDPARVRFGKPPAGWRVVSDLDHPRPITVADVIDSVILAGADLTVVDLPQTQLRIATRGVAAPSAATLEGLAAARGFWREDGPYLAVIVPAAAGQSTAVPRGDGVLLRLAPSDQTSRWAPVRAHARAMLTTRTARLPPQDPAPAWYAEGVADFVANRALARAGLEPPTDSSGRISDALSALDLAPINKPAPAELAARRGAVMALKWDEDVRRASAGKADLDDVLLQMRDHYARFPPDAGPNLTDSLVSAVWVTANLDIRPDLERYIARAEPPPIPETLFGGCLELRTTTRPIYDTGFDHTGSIAAKTVRGVSRYGPAYASGLRNGMRLESWTIAPDTTREVVVTVRDARGRGRARTIRYWPYSDEHVDVRRLQLKPAMGQAELAACGKKLGGL